MKNLVTVVVIDSRSKEHPDWIETCKNSILNQTLEVDELIIVDNIENDKTIGKCWNEAVKQARNEWIFFVGDDSWLARDCVQVMVGHIQELPCVTTHMTMFNEQGYKIVFRPCTGMWRKDYLLEHPFNETLKGGIDREYFQEFTKRGDSYVLIDYYFGHYDRRHDDNTSGKVVLEAPEKTDIYVTSSSGVNFITPLIKEWRKNRDVFAVNQPLDPKVDANILWCEWGNENAVNVANFKTDAKKFLRMHAYEAYSQWIFHIKWDAYEKVIFIAKHIKDRVEAVVGKIPNAVVIPVGIRLNGFEVRKERNNKIAYAGQISRKKGAGELMLLAKSLPDYEFHIAGKYTEDDVADYFNFQKPDNVFIHPYSYNLNEWLKDYTYIINTSMREGNPITTLEAMTCGLKPLVRDWVGAKEIYGDYVYENLDELKKLLEGSYEPEKYRKFVEDNYNFEDTYKEIEKLLEVK